jgi:hypothetical protein
MRDGDAAFLNRMLELLVAANLIDLVPANFFQFLYDLPAVRRPSDYDRKSTHFLRNCQHCGAHSLRNLHRDIVRWAKLGPGRLPRNLMPEFRVRAPFRLKETTTVCLLQIERGSPYSCPSQPRSGDEEALSRGRSSNIAAVDPGDAFVPAAHIEKRVAQAFQMTGAAALRSERRRQQTGEKFSAIGGRGVR